MSRIVAALSVAVLLASGGAAQAKALPKCLTIADPKGDSAPSGTPTSAALNDKTLDITKVRYAVTGDKFVVAITVDTLGDNATLAWGDMFAADFIYDGKPVRIFYNRSRARDAEANAFYQQGIQVSNTFVSGSDGTVKGEYTAATNTMTLTVKVKSLRAAAGKGLEGGDLDAVGASTWGNFVGYGFAWDHAAAPDDATFSVKPCR